MRRNWKKTHIFIRFLSNFYLVPFLFVMLSPFLFSYITIHIHIHTLFNVWVNFVYFVFVFDREAGISLIADLYQWSFVPLPLSLRPKLYYQLYSHHEVHWWNEWNVVCHISLSLCFVSRHSSKIPRSPHEKLEWNGKRVDLSSVHWIDWVN